MNRRETREALEMLGVRAEKALGQNFLINPLATGKIAAALGEGSRSVLEIGPGLGALTSSLVKAGHRVTAVELSPVLSEYMKEKFPEVETVNRDFMKTIPSDLPGHPFDAVASNLPYNISSQVLLRLCTQEYRDVKIAVLMLQKEMAARLMCLDGGRNYGRISLMVWPWFTVRKLFDLSPGEFMPRPGVDSRVVLLKRRVDPPLTGKEYLSYGAIVKAAFSSRRKKVINCLSRVYGADAAEKMLESSGIDRNLRAERIPPEKYAELAGKAEV